MDKKEDQSEFEEDNEEEFMFNMNSKPKNDSVFKDETAVSADIIEPVTDVGGARFQHVANAEVKPEFADTINIQPEVKPEFTPDAHVQKEVSEDPLEKLVGKNYVEIPSADKNSDPEKIPLVSNIAKDIEHPLIIQAPSHHHHHHPVKSEYEEVAYAENLRVKSKKMVDKNAVYAGLVLAVIIILVVFLFFLNKENRAILPVTDESNNALTDEPAAFLSVPVKYSFEKYIYPEDNNYNKEVSLICFLRKETRRVGGDAQYIDYYVVDDYGDKIKLNFFRLKNPSAFEHLFLMNATTKNLFNVSGSLRKEGYQELKLYVSNITGADREYERKEVNG